MTTRTFTVQGMTCSHCQTAVAKALKGVPGVASAEVDLRGKQATVAYDPDKVSEAQLALAVEDAGYTMVLG